MFHLFRIFTHFKREEVIERSLDNRDDSKFANFPPDWASAVVSMSARVCFVMSEGRMAAYYFARGFTGLYGNFTIA